MAYKSSQSNIWITLIRDLASNGARWVKYQFGDVSFKINAHQANIKKLTDSINQLKQHRKDTFRTINYKHKDTPLNALREQNEYNRQNDPLIKKWEEQIALERTIIRNLEERGKKVILTKEAVIPEVNALKLSDNSTLSSTQKIKDRKEYKPIHEKTFEENVQEYYPIENYYRDVNKVIDNYKKYTPIERENFQRTYLRNLKDPELDKGQRLYFLGIIQQIERIEKKVLFTGYAENEIYPNVGDKTELMEMFLNSNSEKQSEIKKLLNEIASNPTNYAPTYLTEVYQIMGEISLLGARQNLDKLNELKQQSKQKQKRTKRGR